MVCAALALGAGCDSGRAPAPAPGKPTTSTSGAVAPPARFDLVEFRDEKAGWAISYPKAWTRLPPPETDVVLVVSEGPPEANAGGSVKARDITLGAAVDEARLAAAKEITDQVVGPSVRQLTQPAVVHQGGLPGWFYSYSFTDPASGREGVHTHYFLFKGRTMISFVFQALPRETFSGLARIYDEMIGSFRVL